MKETVDRALQAAFGNPQRDIMKVKAWTVSPSTGVVLQMDQPKREACAFLWLPYPGDGQTVPDIALEYASETGRHSNTYPSPGLERGKPALKLRIRSGDELGQTIEYIRAMAASEPLPDVLSSSQPDRADPDHPMIGVRVDIAAMPSAEPRKARRQAIPRAVQREVWQRDGGLCAECESRELLCFDHIVPFSKGGGNTVRNIQLLCEPCNLSKGNRI